MSDIIHHGPAVLKFDGHVRAVKGFYNLYDAFAEDGLRPTDEIARIELVSIEINGEQTAVPQSAGQQFAFKATYEYGPVSGRLDNHTGVLTLNTYSNADNAKLNLRLHVWR